MTETCFRRVMKPYGLRDETGTLILVFADGWTGKPCLDQFPLHVRRAALEQPLIRTGIHLEALLTAGHIGGDVFKAVQDDVNCLIATRIMVENFPMDPLTKDAAMAFTDFNGGCRSPLDDALHVETCGPLSLADDEMDEEERPF